MIFRPGCKFACEKRQMGSSHDGIAYASYDGRRRSSLPARDPPPPFKKKSEETNRLVDEGMQGLGFPARHMDLCYLPCFFMHTLQVRAKVRRCDAEWIAQFHVPNLTLTGWVVRLSRSVVCRQHELQCGVGSCGCDGEGEVR